MLLLRHTRRRDFITLLGGAATAAPLAARGQQPGKLPTIGFLGAGTPSSWNQWTAAFVQRLSELGWIGGRTIAIEYRWAEGRTESLAEIATELVRLKVDVIVTSGAAVPAAKQITSVIPIVFAVANDPVGTGMVTSLARPGGNVTGLSQQSRELAGKRLELLREIVPNLRRLAVMANAANPTLMLELDDIEAAARTLGLEVAVFPIRRGADIVPAFAAFKEQAQAQALYVLGSDPFVQIPSDCDQHARRRCAYANDTQYTRIRRSRRSPVLRSELHRPVPARGQLCRQDVARSKASRHAGRAAHQVRSRHQPDHC
jgi:putative ABC transport system substrate-binding protein